MALDMTAFDSALKTIYTKDKVQDLCYKNNPLLALMPKDKAFFGKNKQIPLIYGNPQGRSATFSQAQTRSALSKSLIEDFLLTRVHDYSLCSIDNETLEASKNDTGAFLSAATIEINGALNSLTRSLAGAMYRKGWGCIGQLANSTVTTKVITLSRASDVYNFEIGQELMFSSSEDGAALRALTGTYGPVVTSIDRSAGTVTCSAANLDTTLTTPGTTDFIFIRGDRQDSATPTRLKTAGLEDWIPYTAPGATTFFGVNRAVDTVRLGGCRLDASGYPIEEALIEADRIVYSEGGRIDHFFMNPISYANLKKSLGTKVCYIDAVATPAVSFRGVTVDGSAGPIKCIPDMNCPSNRIHGLQLDTWKLNTLGEPIRIFDTDGLTMLRSSSSDGVDVRAVYYGNMSCSAPGYNITLNV